MKKFIFITLALGLLASPAMADPLPKDYIGVWCDDSDGKDYNALAGELRDGKCLDNETSIRIHQKGYDRNDNACAFVSIQRTGEYTLIPLTKTTYLKIPHIRTVARCGDEEKWKEIREFRLEQGGVMFSKLRK